MQNCNCIFQTNNPTLNALRHTHTHTHITTTTTTNTSRNWYDLGCSLNYMCWWNTEDVQSKYLPSWSGMLFCHGQGWSVDSSHLIVKVFFPVFLCVCERGDWENVLSHKKKKRQIKKGKRHTPPPKKKKKRERERKKRNDELVISFWMSRKQCLVSHDQAVEIEGRRTEKEALFEREGRIKCLQEECDTCFVYFFFP